VPLADPVEPARHHWHQEPGHANVVLGLVLAVIATAQLMVVLDLTIVVVTLPAGSSARNCSSAPAWARCSCSSSWSG
jgi:riboflavin transporter FmnP